MLERVCRTCQTGNALEALTCHVCGADLEAAPAPLARREAPAGLAKRWQQSALLRSPAAKSVALGVAALALDLGAALLSKRSKSEPGTALAPRPASSRAFMRRREWEEFDEAGNLRRRVVEHVLIRDE
jgi:hypothetical protein